MDYSKQSCLGDNIARRLMMNGSPEGMAKGIAIFTSRPEPVLETTPTAVL
jgi:hypothetical protein